MISGRGGGDEAGDGFEGIGWFGVDAWDRVWEFRRREGGGGAIAITGAICIGMVGWGGGEVDVELGEVED